MDSRSPDPSRTAGLAELADEIAACRRCPRLVAWREKVATERRAAYREEEYWGRPVPGFGDPAASIVLVGLAPGAHGSNRTGRMFTGDRSGEWLFAALERAGLSSQPVSRSRADGLVLRGAYITAVVHCAPPGNQPSVAERDACSPYLVRELALLEDARVLVALGKFAFDALCRHYDVRPRPVFGHGSPVRLPQGRHILGCYHPSQQNTFTGRLTEAMLDEVLSEARRLASPRPGPAGG